MPAINPMVNTILLFLAIGCVPVVYIVWRIRVGNNIANAAYNVLADVQKARKAFDTYCTGVTALKMAYSQNVNVAPSQIPALRLQLEEIKFGHDYGYYCEVVEDRGHQIFFIWGGKKERYARTCMAARMYAGMISVLKASKISGFLRSVRLLEGHVAKKNSAPQKQKAMEVFIDDYAEEIVFQVISALEAEIRSFNNIKGILDRLETDLGIIVRQNRFWLAR